MEIFLPILRVDIHDYSRHALVWLLVISIKKFSMKIIKLLPWRDERSFAFYKLFYILLHKDKENFENNLNLYKIVTCTDICH